jgi:hypothetical protein
MLKYKRKIFKVFSKNCLILIKLHQRDTPLKNLLPIVNLKRDLKYEQDR